MLNYETDISIDDRDALRKEVEQNLGAFSTGRREGPGQIRGHTAQRILKAAASSAGETGSDSCLPKATTGSGGLKTSNRSNQHPMAAKPAARYGLAVQTMKT